MINIHRKSGAVLIISLIILLLLTLIGATAIQTTTLEEKMAGNLRDQNLAFQAAETALRAGEAATATISPLNYNAVIPYSEKASYIIEPPKITYEGLETGVRLSSPIYWYQITARGLGASDNAVVRLQSIYKR